MFLGIEFNDNRQLEVTILSSKSVYAVFPAQNCADLEKKVHYLKKNFYSSYQIPDVKEVLDYYQNEQSH